MADIGLIGLAVMGQNLALNIADHGFKICVFNRTVSKVDDFIATEKHENLIGSKDLIDFVNKLKKPRKIFMLVKAGDAVDEFITKLIPLIDKGDIIIDGGNSYYEDTIKREINCRKSGFHFVGCGVSGGEEGARHGPSLMPGGSKEAWPHLKPILQSISAKVEDQACCDWVGAEGSGHFVKMVHNGIEYGDMQLICEAYHLLKSVAKLRNDQIADIFDEWNHGELDSFLIEITSNILRYKDENKNFLIDRILDVAGQKGTGKWSVNSSLEYAIPLTLITEAVFCRMLSGFRDERQIVNKLHPYQPPKIEVNQQFVDDVRKALYASKIISYTQGFMLMREVSEKLKWDLNMGGIALMWRGGCIIRSKFLGDIKTAFDKDAHLKNLLLDDFFKNAVHQCQDSWRRVISAAVLSGIPVPTFSSSLAFFDGYRSAWLPANLLQAQRDYFGAHTYTTIDHPNTFVHTDWTGHGGHTASTNYNA